MRVLRCSHFPLGRPLLLAYLTDYGLLDNRNRCGEFISHCAWPSVYGVKHPLRVDPELF